MKLIIAAIATLITIFTLGQNGEAFDPRNHDTDNPIVEIMPWMPHYEGNNGDAGIYRVNDQYIGLVVTAVRDASRPVTLYVVVDDNIVVFDCRVTPYGDYLRQYKHSIDGIPVIVEINPEFWKLDLSEVEDTYFLSEEYGREWIEDVEFIPDSSDADSMSLYIPVLLPERLDRLAGRLRPPGVCRTGQVRHLNPTRGSVSNHSPANLQGFLGSCQSGRSPLVIIYPANRREIALRRLKCSTEISLKTPRR